MDLDAKALGLGTQVLVYPVAGGLGKRQISGCRMSTVSDTAAMLGGI